MEIKYLLILIVSGFLGLNFTVPNGNNLEKSFDKPVLERGDLYKIMDMVIYKDDRFYASFPSIVKMNDGNYLLAFRRAPDRKVFGGKRTTHADPNSYLVSLKSADGINWSKNPELIYAHAFGGSQDPCLLQLANGTILCASYGWAFLRPDELDSPIKGMSSSPKRISHGGVFLGGYLVKSEDFGKSWNGPIYPQSISIETRRNALGNPLPPYNRGALTEGKDGRLYWVVATKTKDQEPLSNHLIISEDKGETWEYGSEVASDSEVVFNETSIHETPSGDLVAFLRTANFDDEAVIARSKDGGKSFEKWQKMGFKGHPFHALTLPDNRVLLTYGYRHKPYGIRARVLNPECTDFDTAKEIIIREDGGTTDVGYPWSVMLEDNKVLITYYFNNDDGTRHIAGSLMQIQN